jgi:hypothetical protein
MVHSNHWIMTGWHGEQWDFRNNEKTMVHSNHWIMTGWHGEQWNFQNNEKTTEHSDHWIMTGWHGEQWNFQNNEKTMEHSGHWIMTGWQWNILVTESWLDGMENSGIFKTMKRQWNILITESWLDTLELNHDWIHWMAWRTVGFLKQWKDNGTFWPLYRQKEIIVNFHFILLGRMYGIHRVRHQVYSVLYTYNWHNTDTVFFTTVNTRPTTIDIQYRHLPI